MKVSTGFIAALIALALPQTVEAAGVRRIAAPSQARGSNLDVTIWYPASAGGTPVVLGETKFFIGTAARLDAPITEGQFPLILLSHGAGLAGTPQALSWIAAPLADQGFIVAAPTHPGNGGADRSAAETMRLWLRPGDISATLTAMERDAFFKPHLVPGKTGLLGLSMGGGTALAIAGGRIDPKRLAGYCDTDARNASLCGWIRQSGVDLHALDMRLAGRDYTDKRIRVAIAIDPAPVDVFAPESFSEITTPMALVNLGRTEDIPVTARAADVARAIAAARYSTITAASHFSLFAECKPGAAESAEAEDIGDPICADGPGGFRPDIHAQLTAMVTAAFTRELKTGP